MGTILKIIGAITVLVFIGSIFPSSGDNARTTQGESKLDFSLPVYTGPGTVICPIDIAFDRHEGGGIEGATKAASTIFGRSEAVKKAGCQEWKAGQRLFISEPTDGQRWQRATPYEGMPADFIVYTLDLTNKR